MDLRRRFSMYFCASFLESLKGRSYIGYALLKYGYYNFKLEILEYCEPSKCLEREQYYLDLLKPEYNILKTAGSPLGSKHSEDTKKRISESLLGNKYSLGRQRPDGAGKPAVKIKVTDLETGTKTVYPSMNETARALGVPSGSIRMYFSRNTQKPYKGKYLLQKLPSV